MKLILVVLSAVIAVSQGQQCGIHASNLSKTSFPWTVKIREAETGDFVCMGTIVSSRHVVTAAHCLWPKSYYKTLKVTSKIYVEVLNEKFDLMDVRIHPEWNFNSHVYDADVAVLTLFSTLKFSDSVQPICLSPNGGDIIIQGGVFAGMNNLAENHEFHEQVEVEKNEDCFKNFPESYKNTSKRTFCANWPSGNFAIHDEYSGAYYHKINDQWFMQGIESKSFIQKRECDIRKHTIFAHIGQFSDWIMTLVKRDTEKTFKDVELKCTFVRNYEGLYGCEVENMVNNSPNIRIATISGKHLDNLSNQDVEYVWIKNSKVNYLPRFSPIFFPKMKKYLITNSEVKFVSRDDFMGMPLLETIDLSQNEIEEIPEDAFYDLNELVDLFISNNKIKYLSQKMLSQAPLFQRFRADNNTLEVLDSQFFSKNPSLKIVSLDNNRLKKIRVDFSPFRNLKKLDLLNNQCVSTNYNDWRRFKTPQIVQKEIEASCL